MNVQKVSFVRFGNYGQHTQHTQSTPNQYERFYAMNDSQKLNVLYKMLMDVRLNQENSAETLTNNQYNMHLANLRAFQYMTDDSYSNDQKREQITDTFENSRVGQIPSIRVQY